jgi:hypothetical protein
MAPVKFLQTLMQCSKPLFNFRKNQIHFLVGSLGFEFSGDDFMKLEAPRQNLKLPIEKLT